MFQRNKTDDRKHLYRVIEGILEVLLLLGMFYVMWVLWYRDLAKWPLLGRGKYILVGLYALILLVTFFMCDCFKFGYFKLSNLVASQIISIFITDFITYFQFCLMTNHMLTVWPIAVLFGTQTLLCIFLCFLFTAIYHANNVPRDMLLIYGMEESLDIKFKMDTRAEKYCITEIADYRIGFEKLVEKISHHDAIIVNDIPADVRNDILKYCYEKGVRLYAAPKISDIILGGGEEIALFDTPLILIKGRGLTLSQRFVKRVGDVLLSSIALVVLSPFMLIIALLIHLQDRGPVFYRQNRVTKDGKVFSLLKFRSMIVDAEKNGVIPATGKDPRITKVGAVIRATRMDELPQLFNILKGDMSIVGPRPERCEHVEKYSREISEWHFREKVKGGLTGYAQIYGRYNTSAYDKLRMDLLYIENYSAIMDIKLILMTLRVLLSKESTEGFEVQKQREEKRKKMLLQAQKEAEEAEKAAETEKVAGVSKETGTDSQMLLEQEQNLFGKTNAQERVIAPSSKPDVKNCTSETNARVIGDMQNASNLSEVVCIEQAKGEKVAEPLKNESEMQKQTAAERLLQKTHISFDGEYCMQGGSDLSQMTADSHGERS